MINGSTNIDSPRKIPMGPTIITGQNKMTTYEKGQIWGALRKAWKGYRIAKVQGDNTRMREYATRIKTLQTQLGVPEAKFPNIGM